MPRSNATANKPETFAMAVWRSLKHKVAIPLALVLYAGLVPAAAATDWTFNFGTAAQTWPLTGWTNSPTWPNCGGTGTVANSRTFTNVNASNIDIRVTVAITAGCFIDDGGTNTGTNSDYPALSYAANGGAAGTAADLQLNVDFTNNTTSNVLVTYDFFVTGTTTVAPVAMKGQALRDIDYNPNAWQDVVTLQAVNDAGGGTINPDFIVPFTATPAWTAGTNTITATVAGAGIPSTNQNGWASYNFATKKIRSMTVSYTPGNAGGRGGTPPNPSQQLIYLSGFVFSNVAVVTQAVVSDVRAYVDGGKPVVEWDTVSEIGTVGFNVHRLDPATGNYVKVNNSLLPALIGSPAGGTYRHPDPGLAAGGTVTYRIEEVEAWGSVRSYGPFTVKVGAGPAATHKKAASLARLTPGKRTDGYERTARAPDGRVADQALASAQLKTAKLGTLDTALRIEVEQDGLYTVGAGEIASALGVTLKQAQNWIGQGKMRLQQKGQQVSWMASPDNNNLVFYGQAVSGTDSVYTRYNVYWLDQANGDKMKIVLSGKVPAGPAGVQPFQSQIHAEENLRSANFILTDPNPDADFWYWDVVVADDPTDGAKNFPVPTPGVIRSGTATLRATLQGGSDLAPGNDHHAHVLVNGVEVGSAVWDGIRAYTFSASFDALLLAADGNNIVTIRGTLDPGVPLGAFWVNGFDVDYPRGYQASGDQLRLRSGGNALLNVGGFGSSSVAVLDISDPRKPKWLASATVTPAAGGYAVGFVPANANTDYIAAVAKAPAFVEPDTPSSTLKTKNNNASYLVLTPASLRTGADSLAAYRSGRVIELQDIYDEFNFGIANPNAIRSFLSYANQNWSTRPRYVALVGKGTIDPKDYKGFGTNLFPVLMASTPRGLAASDNRYVDFNNNGTPDIAIGRIPALDSADVTRYVTKLIAYNSSNRGPAKQALLAADVSEAGGDFTGHSLAVAKALQARGFTTIPVYLDQTTAAQAGQQIVSNLNSPSGVGLFHYVGHGSTGALSNDDIFDVNTVDQLGNGTHLPVFLAFTCFVGDGTFPGFDSLAEKLLWRQGGGAVAAFAPAGVSDDAQAHTLDLGLVNALVGAGASATLGDAAVAAVADLAKNGGERYMLERYFVIGDPALKLHP